MNERRPSEDLEQAQDELTLHCLHCPRCWRWQNQLWRWDRLCPIGAALLDRRTVAEAAAQIASGEGDQVT
jgi:hypothetical protein